MALLGKQIADSGVLKLIQQMLNAGYEAKGQRFETPRGTPQGGVISPLLSNILLTPFDKEMRQKGYRLTRWADDWVVTCRTRAEAEHALARAGRILETLGVTLNREKTRIVHIAQGFEFLGFKIGRGKGRFKLTRDRIKSKLNRQNLYAMPTQKSVDRFKDQIRALTMRRIPLRLGELIETINPIIRGWGAASVGRASSAPTTGRSSTPTLMRRRTSSPSVSAQPEDFRRWPVNRAGLAARKQEEKLVIAKSRPSRAESSFTLRWSKSSVMKNPGGGTGCWRLLRKLELSNLARGILSRHQGKPDGIRNTRYAKGTGSTQGSE